MKQNYKNFIKTLINKKNLKAAAKWVSLLFLGGFALILLMFFYYTWNLPKPEKFTETPFIQSTKIYDRTGKVLLYDIFGEEKREIVPFDKISQNLKNAIIASEDARFYQHIGIDFEGILRAIIVDLKLGEKSQGGSTITQQLIRSVYLTNQKSIARKVREVVLSIELEQKYSKDQIFDWYLNKKKEWEEKYPLPEEEFLIKVSSVDTNICIICKRDIHINKRGWCSDCHERIEEKYGKIVNDAYSYERKNK